ncbi:hypothetical protein [uncultured Helicobacter sp.]|uniref:hypothetical protein n=1 Tax=uncultured Helicobacter sp. TaxID=175537 RepID=UPI0026030B28|nr:hypothetical protein [uncultured Helicobacter sp.]
MKTYIRIFIVGLLGLVFAACGDSNEKALKDSEIGLRKVDLQNEQDVALLQYGYSEAMAGVKARGLSAPTRMHRL